MLADNGSLFLLFALDRDSGCLEAKLNVRIFYNVMCVYAYVQKEVKFGEQIQ